MPSSSTVDGERHSRIAPGTFVDYVVTEYGIAELRRTRRRDTTASRFNCR